MPMLVATSLVDVSYSIKQNGVMINLDYKDPIDDDDIIGWKSDRGWVYLTLLGVKAPKRAMPQQYFKGLVKKIVIDDFDESTQLAILINKPVLGYDIINSKTSPSTIVFIHTEMKKSEVANLQQHIKEDGVSVFNIAKSSGFPKFNTNFKNAFDQARKELGANAIFEYHGKLYTTNHPGEKEAMAQSILLNQTSVLNKEVFKDKNNIDKTENNYINKNKFKEIYIDNNTGEILTELVVDTLVSKTLNPSSTTISKEKNATAIGQPELVENENLLIAEPVTDKSVKISKWKRFKRLFSRKKNTDEDHEKTKEAEDFIKNIRIEPENLAITETKVLTPEDNIKLQKKYVPPRIQNINENLTDNEYYTMSQTQFSDSTKVQELQLTEQPPLKSDIYKQLQKKHVPLPSQNIFNDTMRFTHRVESSTQPSDTNIVQAWFNDETILSEKYDPKVLQHKHIPPYDSDLVFDSLDETLYQQSPPQSPEFTAPFILDKRLKTQYKNQEIIVKPRHNVEKHFKPDTTKKNTWLSFFPEQKDSIRKNLKWDFKEENEIPLFLQRDSETLDYSSKEDLNYTWKKQLSNVRPKSFPPRYSDPGFRYYHEGGIRIESNIDGVPIYVDGKYVGDTPLSRPIQVEPGWHQVSGFSPVYTHLASQKGLQFVGYDSIINNNELYGSTTVYAEAGKLEIVSLKFNQMGDTPKKWKEISGGMNLGIPLFSLLIGLISWAM